MTVDAFFELFLKELRKISAMQRYYTFLNGRASLEYEFISCRYSKTINW